MECGNLLEAASQMYNENDLGIPLSIPKHAKDALLKNYSFILKCERCNGFK